MFVGFLLLLIPGVVMSECFGNNSINKVRDLYVVLECFDTQINRLNKENKNLKSLVYQLPENGSAVSILKDLPRPEISMSTISNNFKFDLLKCKRKSRVVSCMFQITNMGDDVNFWFNNGTRAFDEFGKEYKPGLANIVDASSDLSQSTEFKKHLISNVPVNAKIEFNGVSTETTQFTALNIVSYRTNYFTVKLRNVVITQ